MFFSWSATCDLLGRYECEVLQGLRYRCGGVVKKERLRPGQTSQPSAALHVKLPAMQSREKGYMPACLQKMKWLAWSGVSVLV